MQEGTPKKVLKLHQDSAILEKMLVLGAGKFHVVTTGWYSRMA